MNIYWNYRFSNDCPENYYDELHRSADNLFELGIQVIPWLHDTLPKSLFTGLDLLREDRDLRGLNGSDLAIFGLEGTEICGEWHSDGLFYDGVFATHLYADDEPDLKPPGEEHTIEYVHDQIRLAQRHGLSTQFGIAANTWSKEDHLSSGSNKVNSVLITTKAVLQKNEYENKLRIETDGLETWTYAHINFEDSFFHDLSRDKKYKVDFLKDFKNQKTYFLPDSHGPWWTTIVKHGIKPCYPSVVLGRHVKLVNSLQDKLIFIIKSGEELANYLNPSINKLSVNKIPEKGILQEEVDASTDFLTPEEDEQVFQQAVKAIEADRLKVIRKQPETILNTMGNEHVEHTKKIKFVDILPKEIAVALQLLSQYLPYDDISVAMAFITGAAGMIKLGTKVEGNIATRFQVPINFYTAIVAQSGRKKTPLQKIFVREPARNVLLEVASINNNEFQNWQEVCRGKSKDEKPPKPVAIDVRISDYTAEALVIALRRLDELGLALLIERDEINGLFNSLNMYKGGKGADEQQLLELYDGGAYRSLRQSDSTRGFQRSAVNIFGAVQPEILFNLIATGDASGKWARFIFVPLPDKTVRLPDKLSDQEKAEIDQAENLLQQIIYTIYKHDCFIYKLSSEAIKLFSEYEHEKQRDVLDAKLPAQSSLYGKSAGKVLRMAGVLHILWNYANRNELFGEISPMILQKAMCIVDHLDIWMLETHAKVAGAKSYNLDSFGKRIHDIALKSQLPVSWTEIRNQMSSTEKSKKTAIDAEKSMQALVEMNLGQISKGDRGGLCYKAIKPL